MTIKTLSGLLLFSIFSVSSIQAQFTQDPNDAGVPDTVEMVVSVSPNASANQLQVQLDLWFFNDSDKVVSVSMGFIWDNPNLQMDSAKVTPLADEAFDFLKIFYEGSNIGLTNENQRFVFAASRIFGTGIEISQERKHIASYFFTLSSWTVDDLIILDTLQYNSGTVFKFVNSSNKGRKPFWAGGIEIRDPDFVDPSNLVLSGDTLFFSAVAGGAPPEPQTFSIESDNSPINFSLSDDASWLLKSPTSGTTPQDITVSIITAGLSEGILFDSIIVNAAQVTNSPQFKYVQLEIVPPPPTIGISPTLFSFNAVAGGDNPSPKTLTITNTGGSTLQWSVSNSEMWLQLAPVMGTDSGDVELSIDVAGLAFDTYFDTIIVTDPEATNDPVMIPVQLSVSSDLPLIDVDSTHNIFLITDGTPQFFERTFEIRNGGGGSMNFNIEYDSDRIDKIQPLSGAAPATITVTYKATGMPGMDLYDTLWVFSEEATNSPVMVVNQLHFVDEPAVLSIDRDTIKFHLFECSQGLVPAFNSGTFVVSNIGGDEPLEITIFHSSNIFNVPPTVEEAPAIVTATLKDTLPPIGIYVDTIVVFALYALNQKDTVYLILEVTPGDQAAMITPTDSELVVSYEATTNPQLFGPISVFNQFGGCMPWAIFHNEPWVTPTIFQGNVADTFSVLVDGTEFSSGIFNDTIYVSSEGAANSPFPIPVTLLVWLRGDWNFDGIIDIADLTGMIDGLFFLTENPPPAAPVPEVGDVDCDGIVDIGDLTHLINHLFIFFPPIDCGLN